MIRLVTRVRAGFRAIERDDDSGMSLVELIIAMGIFSIILAIFGSGVTIMTKSTVRTQQVIDTENEGRRAFAQLDKQVRSAAAVNAPALVGSTRWVVEFRTDVDPTGQNRPAFCTQWRLDTTGQRLQTRQWNVGSTSVPAWRTVATNVVNTPTQRPFTFSPTSNTNNRQRLAVDLRLQKGSAPVSKVESTLVARNSSARTSTNTTGTRTCTEMDASR